MDQDDCTLESVGSDQAGLVLPPATAILKMSVYLGSPVLLEESILNIDLEIEYCEHSRAQTRQLCLALNARAYTCELLSATASQTSPAY